MSTLQEKSHSILVVEDDQDIRTSLVELLESEGYKTEAAENGQRALEILRVIPKPCLVLLDMMMPVMDGREFLNEVKKDSQLAPIPILIVSAVAEAKESGTVGFVRKPIDIDVILRKVNQFCH